MPQVRTSANPFQLMMDPDAVFAALERSERLACLKSRICRPLDQPRPAPGGDEVAAFDQAIEASRRSRSPAIRWTRLSTLKTRSAGGLLDLGSGIASFAGPVHEALTSILRQAALKHRSPAGRFFASSNWWMPARQPVLSIEPA